MRDAMTIYEMQVQGVWMPLALGTFTLDGRMEDWLYVPGTFYGVTIPNAERGLAEGWIRERPALKQDARRPTQQQARAAEPGTDRPADRPAARSWGHAMHVRMARAGVADHYAFASSVVGRQVEHLSSLSAGERRRVEAALLRQEATEFMPA